MDKKRILFVTYGGGHANAILPLVKLVREKDEYNFSILALTMARKIFDNEGISYLSLSDFATKEIMLYGEKLLVQLEDINSYIPLEESMAYYGFGMKDLIETYGEKDAYQIFEKEGRKAFLPTQTMEMIIKRINPDILVTTSSPRMEQASIIAARNLGLDVLRIEQLFYAENLDIPRDVHFAVINDIVKQKLIKNGIDESFITITGQPAFDKLMDTDLIYKKSIELMNELGLSYKDKVLLWISPGNKDQISVLEKLVEIEKKYRNIKVIIKLHPNEDGEKTKRYIDKNNSSITIIKSDLHSLIQLASIVVVEFSSVGLEAILLDKDLILINEMNIKGKIPYAETGAAIEVENLSLFENAVNRVLYNESVQKELAIGRKKFIAVGNATQNVYELINRIVTSNRGS